MKTADIKIWDGTGTPTDYRFKDRDYERGTRVRVIQTRSPRKVYRDGSYIPRTVHDGVLIVHLKDDGTPTAKTNSFSTDHFDGQLRTETTIARFIVDTWEDGLESIRLANQRKADQQARALENRRSLNDLIQRANALIESEIPTYRVNYERGTVGLERRHLRELIEAAESALSANKETV